MEKKCVNCDVPRVEGSYGPVCREDIYGHTTEHEWGPDFKRILDRLRARMEFHDDAEVHWEALHYPPMDILESGNPEKCATCGNDIFDDRWHFLWSVTANEERFKVQACIYEKLLHKQRREYHAQIQRVIHRKLFGFTGMEQADEERITGPIRPKFGPS